MQACYSHPLISDEYSFGDKACELPPVKEIENSSASGSPIYSPIPLRVYCPNELMGEPRLFYAAEYGDPSLLALTEGKDDGKTFLLDNVDDENPNELNSYAEHYFHSLQFDNSIVRHIEQLGMEPSFLVVLSS